VGAEDASQAIAILERDFANIGLVLTDIAMPGMQGPELADAIDKRWPQIGVAFMSAHPESVLPDSIVKSQRPFLRKPFAPDQLTHFVRSAMAECRNKATILIADDDSGVRQVLRDILHEAGYQVVEADSGRRAAAYVASNRVNLVISDVLMPSIEGILEVAQEHPDIPIIAISGASGPSFQRVARTLGAFSTMQKPIQPRQLLAQVRSALRREQAT
jgi:DNA-binding NtrC family response regulator